MKLTHFRDLEVYQKAKENSLEIFKTSKLFPKEERYALTDQIRRSSRSVCANIAEAWRKRRYKAAFLAKLSDAESECAETQVWLEFAFAFEYINEVEFLRLDDSCEHASAMLIKMATNVEKWTVRK